MSSAPVPTRLWTAEEYGRRDDPGHSEELVRGRIVPMPQPKARHGQICIEVGHVLRRFLDDHPLGHVLCGTKRASSRSATRTQSEARTLSSTPDPRTER